MAGIAEVSERTVASEKFGEEGFSGDTSVDRPVDLVHLSRYTMGNRSLEREVLRLFCCQSELFVERLRDAADSGTWQEAAHTLKGSAKSIGAWHVAGAAEAVEKLAPQCATSKARSAVEEVAEQVAAANQFIREILSDA